MGRRIRWKRWATGIWYNQGMTPAERRTAAVKLLARIDQGIAECESLLSDRRSRPGDKRSARVQRDFPQEARKRDERSCWLRSRHDYIVYVFNSRGLTRLKYATAMKSMLLFVTAFVGLQAYVLSRTCSHLLLRRERNGCNHCRKRKNNSPLRGRTDPKAMPSVRPRLMLWKKKSNCFVTRYTRFTRYLTLESHQLVASATSRRFVFFRSSTTGMSRSLPMV